MYWIINAMRRNIIIIAVLCVCIFASCCSIRHLDIPHQEDYTQFDNGEHLTLISLYEISDDSFCDTIQTGFCLIEGQICVRDGIERYSGEPFDKFYYIRDWPHFAIPSLGINQIIENGYFNMVIPEGFFDVILYADGYYPIHYKHRFESQHRYEIRHLFGYTAIH